MPSTSTPVATPTNPLTGSESTSLEELLLLQPKGARITAATVASVIEDESLDPAAMSTPEQRERAGDAPTKKGGLRGKALAVWIATGKDGAAQTRTAAATKPGGKRSSGKKGGSATKPGARKAAGSSTNGTKAGDRAGRKTPLEPREGSGLHSALVVLKATKRAMTPAEIWEEIKKRGLDGRLKGKTPEATIGAMLSVANKDELHVERAERGKYQLRKA